MVRRTDTASGIKARIIINIAAGITVKRDAHEVDATIPGESE